MIDTTKYRVGLTFNDMIDMISREIENESFDYFLVPLRGGYVFFDFLNKSFQKKNVRLPWKNHYFINSSGNNRWRFAIEFLRVVHNEIGIQADPFIEKMYSFHQKKYERNLSRFNDYSIKEEFKYDISKRASKHNRHAVELKKILNTKAGKKDILKILVIDEVKSGHCLDSTIGTVYPIIKNCKKIYIKVFGICVNNGNELKRSILQSLNNMNVDLIFIDDGWWLDNSELLNFTLEDVNNPSQEYIEKSNLISQLN